MDEFHNVPAPIHSITRKRKADPDDCSSQDVAAAVDPNNTPEPMLLDPSATPRIPSKPTDHSTPPSWLLAQHAQPIVSTWEPSPSPPPSPTEIEPPFSPSLRREGPSRPKRPRIEIPQSTLPTHRRFKRGRTPHTPHSTISPSPRRFTRHIRAGELRDTGIVSATELGLSRLPSLRPGSFPPCLRPTHSAPVSPIDTVSPYVPSHQPPINRETLKELDLEAILRNPQLRHDLLFDSGLQFRPTSSRRKRELADNYWNAITRELETGCTCSTVDAHQRLRERVCVCSKTPIPFDKPIRVPVSPGNAATYRTPSRLTHLLSELLEVLISIIQPVVTRSPNLAVHPGLLHPQYTQNSTHVARLRSILDADLIQQTIAHNLFDPSGVFQEIGDVIRCYCAPMRDHAVDQMVKLAQSCAPDGTGTKADAVKSIRHCFEIMELMKLDVANHQLQTLRPYLVHSAAQFELKMFQESRQKGQLSLNLTREWLRAAFSELAEQNVAAASQDAFVSVSRSVPKPSRHVQIQTAVTKAIVGLIFDPPSSASSPPNSPTHRTTNQAGLTGYPETLYLDHSRLASLSTDAADFTAVYMLLMLYRQLVHSGGFSTQNMKLDELLALKKEVWEIGPQHPGYCFVCPGRNHSKERVGGAGQGYDRSENKESKTAEEWSKWRNEINDVVLQLAMRAGDARSRVRIPTSTSSTPSTSHPPREQGAQDLSTRTPDAALLKLATSWTESNLRAGSSLGTLMRKRIRKLVEQVAIELVVPCSKKANCGPLEMPSGSSMEKEGGAASGLEPLMPEINHLAEKLSKLVSIHMDVYGALYAQPGFVLMD